MGLLAVYAVPHPPLIVPAVGRGQEALVADTVAAYDEVARRTAAHRPDLVVITSPHAPAYRDGFFVSDADAERGSLAQFGVAEEAVSTRVDTAFSEELRRRLELRGIPCAGAPIGHEGIDHGSFVPLHFLRRQGLPDAVSVVRIGLSGLSAGDHELLGREIAETAEDLGRRLVLVASGDLSHKLKPDGPYGFDVDGPRFDAAVTDIFRRGALSELFALDGTMCDQAAECGLRSFMIAAGALRGLSFTPELLSYEGPFGVGYAVAAFEVDGAEELSEADASGLADAEGEGCDPFVALARATVEAYVKTGEVPPLPADLPDELAGRRAGAFVSLHERGELRGCIGTIAPTRRNLAEEVAANAVAACSQDPRFPPVRPDELDYLSYSVDVLGSPEPVSSLEELDPKRYGVIVTRGLKRGLLLPDLEGVDTVFDQVAIAKRKAGIAPGEDAKLERFEVVRHSAGGQARRG